MSEKPTPGLVIVSPVLPQPVKDGFTLRVADMAAYLSRFFRLAYVVFSRDPVADDATQRLRAAAEHLEVIRDPMAQPGALGACRRLYYRLRRRIQRPRPFWACYAPPALARAVNRAVTACRASIVIVHTPLLAPCLRDVRTRVLAVIDTLDIWHERYRQFAAMGQGALLEHFRDPADEARLLATANLIVAITKDDAAALEQLVPGAYVVTAGISHRAVELDRRADAEPLVLFVGGRGATNEDAVTFFVEKIWPRVLSSEPNARFCVLNASDRLALACGHRPGVQLLGRQEDLSAWYLKARVVVDPLRFGTGLKIKVVEALSHGAALVLTSVAARGVGGHAAQHYLVRDDPAAFADAVTQLLAHGEARRRLQKEALAFAREAFAPERVYADLIGALKRRS